jgi:hypothetical protein
MEQTMSNSTKQHEANVETMYHDWLKIVNLCGIGSPPEHGMFKAYLVGRRELQDRILLEGGISAKVVAIDAAAGRTS